MKCSQSLLQTEGVVHVGTFTVVVQINRDGPCLQDMRYMLLENARTC